MINIEEIVEDPLWWNPNVSTWNEEIFCWCQETGFNPFGSGPTPIFTRQEKLKNG